MIKLTVFTGTDPERELLPSSDSITLGRSTTCTVVLQDGAASRRNASIERRGNDYILTDLQSGNGTFVNNPGNKLTAPHVLQEGDEILIVKSRIRVEFPAEVEQDAATRIQMPSALEMPPGGAPRPAVPPPPPPPPPQSLGDTILNAIFQPDIPIVLTVIGGPNRGMVYSPSRDVFTLGRAATCDIVLNDTTASRVHASIKREAGRYRLYDENSVNGLYLHTPQNRVYHSDLVDGDVIFVGQNQIRVEIHLSSASPSADTGSEDATRISGTIAGKSFTFTLSALGGGGRTGTEDANRGASGQRGAVSDEATRVVPAQSVAADDATSVISSARLTPPPPPNGPKITLQVIEGSDKGTVFTPPAGATRCTIGRGDQATFRLKDRGASRIHCAIEISAAGFFLVDDSSLNGTFVNQNPDRITRIALKGGEEIQLADTRLKVEITLPEGAVAGDTEEKTSFVAYHAPTPATPATPSVPVDVATPEPAEPAVEDVRSRSAAFKSRLETIAKQSGVTLRPFTVPGTPRQWATVAFMLIAALSSYGFAVLGRQDYYAGGPVSESHAKYEQECATCHPTWGIQPVNSTCAQSGCHRSDLNAKEEVRDDCVSCHTEHRGRTFAIKGGEAQCWSCHKEGMNVRAYSARPMQVYYDQIYNVAAQRSGKVLTQTIEPAALQSTRDSWLKSHEAQETGLRYAHALHEKQVNEDNAKKGVKKKEECFDCHVKLLNEEFTPFPTHTQCIDCHKEVGNADPQVAKANASKDCLKCHTQQDGGITRVKREIDYVVFWHKDHGQTGGGCTSCHASISSETEYRPVLRSAAAYPMPMDACYSCHADGQKATTACLDCHKQHHNYPENTEIAWGWLIGPFNGLLLSIVGLVGAMGAYIYMDTRISRQWIAKLKVAAPEQAEAAPAAGQEGAEHADAGHAGHGGGGDAAAIPPPAPAESGRFPYPTIDADACLPCGTCYDSCPGKVLALSPATHKAAVVTPGACRSLSEGCTICHENCPTGAIRISPTPIVKKSERPDIDPNCESHDVPGIFLGGEVLGNALIKKVVNQGGQIVRYIDTRKPRVPEAQYDIIIVGAGPCGLAAGLEAKQRGLRYLVLERESLANTIQNYPRDKAVLAEPVQMAVYGLLPMKDASKEDLVALWEDIVRKENLQVKTHEEVAAIKKAGNLLTVTTSKGSYQAGYVILALGARGNPRKLGVAGEDTPKVSYNLNDPAEWKGKHVLVVGGGDSAIEAAVAISKQPGATVTLSYRSGAFSRAAARNVESIKEQEKAGRVNVMLNSNVTKVEDRRVSIKMGNETHDLDNEAIFVLIGADPPKAWLEKLGIKFVIVEKTI